MNIIFSLVGTRREIPQIDHSQLSSQNHSLYQIKHIKIMDKKERSELGPVFIYNSHLVSQGFPIYHLKDEKGTLLGVIHLNVIRDYVHIDKMLAVCKYKYSGIGTALHEFAIYESFRRGCEGKVELQASDGSSGFHFKCGYRFDDPEHPTTEKISPDLYLLLKNYFAALKKGVSIEGHPPHLILKDIEQHKNYQLWIDHAQIELNCEDQDERLKDIHQIIRYGAFVDKNEILNRYYLHSEAARQTGWHVPREGMFEFYGPMSLCAVEKAKWKERFLEFQS